MQLQAHSKAYNNYNSLVSISPLSVSRARGSQTFLTSIVLALLQISLMSTRPIGRPV